ncbi:MAG: 1-deoxy-D-xylulose-5-phosphate synthase [Armatimonadota bacterium]
MSVDLNDIKSPADIKHLDVADLEDLAGQIRERLINTLADTGGHLAPNLGTVELTLALHYVFDSPKDKLIWDVGHQCYTHKVLTGRLDRLDTIRQYGGLSGFPKRSESPHDHFGVGHGSTSISAALGFAMARDIRGSDEEVIAIIGDGALTGGLAFEGLNQVGDRKADMMVVLNDNEMSISRNVGAMSSYLSKMRLSLEPRVRQARDDVARVLDRLRVGDAMLIAMDRLRDSVKQLVVPGMLFEEFGFTYLGPIDGHNIEQLQAIFTHARKLDGPILIHALTTKGKGYEPAEDDPARFHGVKPFKVENGEYKAASNGRSYSEIAVDTLIKLAAKDDRICTISAAMLVGTALQKFQAEYPDRCFDVGMAEEHAVTFGAGLAAAGMRPAVCIYSTFMQRTYDQLVHDVALQDLPVTFCLDRAGLVGDDGPTHHGTFDLSFMRSIPGVVLMAPRDGNDLQNMLATAMNYDGPAAVRYPRGSGPGAEIAEEPTILDIGTAEQLREGRDVAIIAVGRMVQNALKACDLLEDEGVQARLIDARFVKPLDEQMIAEAVADCGTIVTVEENVLPGGFGSAVGEMLVKNGLEANLRSLGIPDEFVEHGEVEILWEQIGLTPDAIAKQVLVFLNEENQLRHRTPSS